MVCRLIPTARSRASVSSPSREQASSIARLETVRTVPVLVHMAPRVPPGSAIGAIGKDYGAQGQNPRALPAYLNCHQTPMGRKGGSHEAHEDVAGRPDADGSGRCAGARTGRSPG